MTKDQLARKSLEAVKALLEVIKEKPGGMIGTSDGGFAPGTQGYFAAQAIRQLLETPLIVEAIRAEFGDEDD